MTRKKQYRLILVGAALGISTIAIGLTLAALRGSITYFYTPGDIAANTTPTDRVIRLGGLVVEGSLAYGGEGGAAAQFTVTDGAASIDVSYAGILPDLFREGQGVIVEGRLNPARSHLTADTVLAKHDENYMPKEVADALKEKGRWQPQYAPAGDQ